MLYEAKRRGYSNYHLYAKAECGAPANCRRVLQKWRDRSGFGLDLLFEFVAGVEGDDPARLDGPVRGPHPGHLTAVDQKLQDLLVFA